jgi:hypothetical protein
MVHTTEMPGPLLSQLFGVESADVRDLGARPYRDDGITPSGGLYGNLGEIR